MTLQISAHLRRPGLDVHVDLTLPTHGVTALFGRSGCGKTSLLRVIAGLDRVAGAKVCFAEHTWQSVHTFVPLAQRRIGLVFQESSLLPHLGVRGNLLYGYQRTPAALRRHTPEAIVDLLGLAPLIDRRIDQLSGGQRQRVALGRALLASPQLLLLDEPLSALDSQSKRDIMPLLERLSGEVGVPIIYVSHAATEIERLADQVVLMDSAQVRTAEPIQQALARPDSPLFADTGPASVLMGTLETGDEPELQSFRSGAVTLRLTRPASRSAAPGAARLRIGARDVSLALAAPTGLSILNQLPMRIEAMQTRGEGRVIVSGRLENGDPLLAEISSWSARELALQPGQQVVALVKAVSLLN